MYSLHLTCNPNDVDLLSTQLWEHGTAGIRELDSGGSVTLIAGFASNAERADLLLQFAEFSPAWEMEESVDWVQLTQDAWPARTVGERLYLAPPWSTEPTPPGRIRLAHNPGLACGTGEHPCTQLALSALEQVVEPGYSVADIGTGSGMLAIATKLLNAGVVVGTDTDIEALRAARENFALNQLAPLLVGGSAGSLGDLAFDVTVANISGSVLLSIVDDLRRVTRTGGHLILTGFPEWELAPFLQMFPAAEVTALNEWRCIRTVL
jgi:ribosomal protein L11 methyltransferase